MSARPRTADAKTAHKATTGGDGKSRLDTVLSVGFTRMSLCMDSASKKSVPSPESAVVKAVVLPHMRVASELQNIRTILSTNMKIPRIVPDVGGWGAGGMDLNWPTFTANEAEVLIQTYISEILYHLAQLPLENKAKVPNKSRAQIHVLTAEIIHAGANGQIAGEGTPVRYAYVWLLYFFKSTLRSAVAQGLYDKGFTNAWPVNAKKTDSLKQLMHIIDNSNILPETKEYWVKYYSWVNKHVVNFFNKDFEDDPGNSGVDAKLTHYLHLLANPSPEVKKAAFALMSMR